MKRYSSTFVRDISRQRDYYHGVVDTWLVGIPSFRPGLEYLLFPPGYIPLDISMLPNATANEAHGGVSA